MKTTIHSYNHEHDFERVNRFLIDVYHPNERHIAWLQPRWEYSHFFLHMLERKREIIGIVEEQGQINALVNFEAHEGEVFMHFRPGYEHLKFDLLDYAEEHYSGWSQSKQRPMRAIYVNDFDKELEEEVSRRGYERWGDFWQPMSRLLASQPIPECPLPDGYRLQSLADENDFHKINKVLWRGFNHPGEPPEEEIEGRKFAQKAPHYRHDLTIVAVAPNGDYASFGGMWMVPENKYAYVEPVATDPDHRRLGLGRAVVMESVRRVIAEGAEVIYVGSDLPFYLSMGFEVIFALVPWVKLLD